MPGGRSQPKPDGGAAAAAMPRHDGTPLSPYAAAGAEPLDGRRMSPAAGSRRKVLHVITDLGTGGAEMMLWKLVSSGDRQRFAHAVISLRGRGTIGPRIEESGAAVHPLGMSPSLPSPFALLELRRLLRRLEPQLIVGWMYHGMLASALGRSLAAFGVPVIWNVRQTLYDIRDEKRTSAAVIRACRSLSRRPAATIYNSHLSKGQHIAFGFAPGNAVVIPNGFDETVFKPCGATRAAMRRALGLGADDIAVGIIGRFHPQKDHGTFLKMAAILAGRFPQLRFVMAGTGVSLETPFFRERVASLGLADKALLLDRRDDVPQLMAALDVAVSSSAFNEAFPNVVGEAMASALPMVATDVGDVRAILGDTGRVVPPRDPEALAEAVASVIALGKEGRERLGRRARERLLEHFTLDGVTRAYERLYADVLDGK